MTDQPQPIRERLIEAMGGMEAFKHGWNWRSFDPDKRAEQALDTACTAYHDGLSTLSFHNAEPLQVQNWIERFVKRWVAYMQAGARTANPMITGPARFPVERNRKALRTEEARGEEFWQHANGAERYMERLARSAARAAKSEEAARVDHKEQTFGDVRVVWNRVLDRLQIIFPDKPSDEERAALKSHAFRWSPREGAWQRKLTRNAEIATARLFKQIGLMEQA